MYYLDTSVLLAYTLTKKKEPQKYRAVSQMFKLINSRRIRAVTSFYALHELLVIAISNTAPDWELGSRLARDALRKILSSEVLYIPIPSREDKILRARLFSALPDPSDLPHAISAFSVNSSALIAYDDHFQAISNIIPYKRPEEIVSELKRLTKTSSA